MTDHSSDQWFWIKSHFGHWFRTNHLCSLQSIAHTRVETWNGHILCFSVFTCVRVGVVNAVCDLTSSMHLPVHINYSSLHRYVCRLMSVLISKLSSSLVFCRKAGPWYPSSPQLTVRRFPFHLHKFHFFICSKLYLSINTPHWCKTVQLEKGTLFKSCPLMHE